MTLQEIDAVLRGTGIPTAYLGWPDDDPEAPSAPFICYAQTGANNFAADGVVYFSARRIEAALYTKTQNEAAHGTLEAALREAGIFWTKTQAYIFAQKIFETVYTMEG